jgi:hypothetical protein
VNSYAFSRTPRTPPRVRRDSRSISLVLAMFVLYVLFVLAGACSESRDVASPTGPTISLTMGTLQQVADFTPSLSDAQSRVLPSLGDAASASRLNTELSALTAAFNARDAEGVETQIGLARATLAAYPAAAKAMDAVELSVIDIALDRAAQLIGMPALANRLP